MNFFLIWWLLLLTVTILLEIIGASPQADQLDLERVKKDFDLFIRKIVLDEEGPERRSISEFEINKANEILGKIRIIAEQFGANRQEDRDEEVKFTSAILNQFSKAEERSNKENEELAIMLGLSQLTEESLRAKKNIQLFHLLFSFALRMAYFVVESKASAFEQRENFSIIEAMRKTKTYEEAANVKLPIFNTLIAIGGFWSLFIPSFVTPSFVICWDYLSTTDEIANFQSIVSVIQPPNLMLKENVFIWRLLTDFLKIEKKFYTNQDKQKTKLYNEMSAIFIKKLYEVVNDSIVVWNEAKGQFDCKNNGPMNAERAMEILERIQTTIFPKIPFRMSWLKLWQKYYTSEMQVDKRKGKRHVGKKEEEEKQQLVPSVENTQQMRDMLSRLFSFAIQLTALTNSYYPTDMDTSKVAFSFLATLQCFADENNLQTAENISNIIIKEGDDCSRNRYLEIEWIMPDGEEVIRWKSVAENTFNTLLHLSKLDKVTPYSLVKFANIVIKTFKSGNRSQRIKVDLKDSFGKMLFIVSGGDLTEIVEKEGAAEGKQTIEVELSVDDNLCEMARFGWEMMRIERYVRRGKGEICRDLFLLALGDEDWVRRGNPQKYSRMLVALKDELRQLIRHDHMIDDGIFYENFIRINFNPWIAKMQVIEDIKNFINHKVYKNIPLFLPPEAYKKGGETLFMENIEEETVEFGIKLFKMNFDFDMVRKIAEKEAARVAKRLDHELAFVAEHINSDSKSLIQQELENDGSKKLSVSREMLRIYHPEFTGHQKVQALKNAFHNMSDKLKQIKEQGFNEPRELLETEPSREYLELIAKLEDADKSSMAVWQRQKLTGWF